MGFIDHAERGSVKMFDHGLFTLWRIDLGRLRARNLDPGLPGVAQVRRPLPGRQPMAIMRLISSVLKPMATGLRMPGMNWTS